MDVCHHSDLIFGILFGIKEGISRFWNDSVTIRNEFPLVLLISLLKVETMSSFELYFLRWNPIFEWIIWSTNADESRSNDLISHRYVLEQMLGDWREREREGLAWHWHVNDVNNSINPADHLQRIRNSVLGRYGESCSNLLTDFNGTDRGLMNTLSLSPWRWIVGNACDSFREEKFWRYFPRSRCFHWINVQFQVN